MKKSLQLKKRRFMAVVFESIIKSDSETGWCIELKDTMDGRSVICKDLDEYEIKIAEMGKRYAHQIDEVKWLQEANLHPSIIDEVRLAMSAFQEKYQEELMGK
jgi:hypothetical protein